MFISKNNLLQRELHFEAIAKHYEARIAELKSQITDLKKLVFSQTSAQNIPLVSLEADAVLSQKEETIEIDQEELKRIQDDASEADRVLSGNY